MKINIFGRFYNNNITIIQYYKNNQNQLIVKHVEENIISIKTQCVD